MTEGSTKTKDSCGVYVKAVHTSTAAKKIVTFVLGKPRDDQFVTLPFQGTYSPLIRTFQTHNLLRQESLASYLHISFWI
jgi:hypothetical protein